MLRFSTEDNTDIIILTVSMEVIIMQMCPECGYVYDESEYTKCPKCYGYDYFPTIAFCRNKNNNKLVIKKEEIIRILEEKE